MNIFDIIYRFRLSPYTSGNLIWAEVLRDAEMRYNVSAHISFGDMLCKKKVI
jgi:hypothetical protein